MARRTQGAGNVPVEVTSFVGRRQELAEARKVLATARLITLVGPGGVGKTRLALRIAADLGRACPDGAWVVGLGDVHEPALVDNAALTALGLRDQAGTEPRSLLAAFLADKDLLLVLDSCEHVLEAAGTLIGDVLQAAPRTRVVATSREPTGVPGEHVLPVAPLPLPSTGGHEPLGRLHQNDSVALFTERAAAASGTFELTAANRDAVVEVCRRLDGLPLAIELAAVRTRALTPHQIRDLLDRRFDLLTGGGRGAVPRHQTLRATIDWSFDLLTAGERLLLSRMCVFAGRFTLADAEAVCSSEEVPADDVLTLLSSLLDKSLVVRDQVGDLACYRLHESTREYARATLPDAAQWEALEQRWADHFVLQSEVFAAEGRHRLLAWVAWTDVEIDNVRAVLRRCAARPETGLALRLATNLVWYWVTRATTEGVRWMDEVLPHGAGTSVPPWAHFVRGFLAVLQGEPAAAAPALARAVAGARALPEPGLLVQSLAMASIAASMAGDRDASRRLLEEARALAPGADDVGASLMTHQAVALNGFVDGDLGAVTAAAADGARLSRAIGDRYSLGMMLMSQGYATLLTGDALPAAEFFAEGLRVAREVDDRVAQCYLLGGLACCAAAGREPHRAARLLGAMERLRAEAGAATHPGLAPTLASTTRATTVALGAARFEVEHLAGRRMDRSDAARLALHEVPDSAASGTRRGAVLSRREAEVADLVAEGLSNREIGARLFISERTVESHVRKILERLGFTNRTQVAGWMATLS